MAVIFSSDLSTTTGWNTAFARSSVAYALSASGEGTLSIGTTTGAYLFAKATDLVLAADVPSIDFTWTMTSRTGTGGGYVYAGLGSTITSTTSVNTVTFGQSIYVEYGLTTGADNVLRWSGPGGSGTLNLTGMPQASAVTCRVQVDGTNIRVKWWTPGAAEPGTWNVETTTVSTYLPNVDLGFFAGIKRRTTTTSTANVMKIDDVNVSTLAPAAVNVSYTAQTATMDVSSPDAVATAQKQVNYTAAAMAMTVSTPTPTVVAVDNSGSSNTATNVTIAVDVFDPTVTTQSNVDFSAGAATVNISTTSPTVTAVGNNAIEASIMEDTPSSFYKMEDTNGTDEVGGRNLTLNNVTVSDGYQDANGYVFNGTDSFASMTSLPAITTAFTFEQWVKSDGANGFSSDYNTFVRRDGTDIVLVRGRGSSNVSAPGQAEIYVAGASLYSGQRVDDGLWHHIVVSVDGANASLYVDGAFKGAVNTGKSSYNFGTGVAYIGAANGNSEYLDGSMDNLAIYNYALGTERISAHYNAGFNMVSHVSMQAEVFQIDVNSGDGTPHAVKNVNVTAPSFAINVVGQSATPTVNRLVTINPESATISLDVVNPEVLATDTVLVQAEVTDISIDTFDATGGDPNADISVEIADITVLVPNGAEAIGGHDNVVTTDAAEITTTILEPSVSNITDVLVQATAIGVRIKLAGFYNREEDKWADFIEDSLTYPDALSNTGDRWFRFEETPGATTAADDTGNVGATYVGNPTLRTDALDDRHAVTLDGIDDYIDLLPLNDPGIPVGTPVIPPAGSSVEFVFRTTATSGTIFSGDGFFNLEVTANGMRWSQASNAGNNWTEKFLDIDDSFVSDGQWHHVIWFINEGQGRTSLQLDGKIVWSRAAWNNWTPRIPTRIGMRETTIVNTYSGGTSPIVLPARPLQASFMEFIIRQHEDYDRDAGLRSYYILNNHTVVEATVADTISVSAPTAKGRGNQKKMLVIWGNGEEYNPTSAFTSNVYYSAWSGMRVPRGLEQDTNSNPHLFYSLYPQQTDVAPGTINYKGYKVYYANMYGPGALLSTPGVVKNNGEDYFYDNETGEPRYIDVNKDLEMDITDFDTVHVMHWPGPNKDILDASDNLPYFQLGDEFNYDRARDLFKKSIRKAVDKGVSLWIAQAQQAVEFGIAKSWNVHYPEIEGQSAGNGSKSYLRDIEMGGQTAVNLGGALVPGLYTDTYIVRNRRIVNTVTNFSEFPTYFVDESIYWEAFDRLKAHANVYAHKLGYLPNGLTIGAEMTMVVNPNWQGAQKYRASTAHYGLNPAGIVGTVVAQEELTFFRGTQEVENPYKDSVTTVVVERGTILEGAPVGGRVFVELMDNDMAEIPVQQPLAYRNYINGTPTTQGTPSLWDYDSRRNRETFVYETTKGLYVTYYNAEGRADHVGQNVPQVAYGDLPVEQMPYVGMNDRGLNWLGIKADAGFGNAQVFAVAAEVNVTVPTPAVAVVSHTTVNAQAATVRVEMRKPQNIADPDVQINADAVRIDVVGGAKQTILYAEVVTINISTPETSTLAEGEDFIMYLRDDDITLYLGEDY